MDLVLPAGIFLTLWAGSVLAASKPEFVGSDHDWVMGIFPVLIILGHAQSVLGQGCKILLNPLYPTVAG